MLFVYWLEDHPSYAPRIKELFEWMERRGDLLCTSTFAVGEILAAPRQQNSTALAAEIRRFFRPPTVDLIPFTVETADRFARIRAQHRVSPADAIHLASAAEARANLFLTSDKAVSKLVIDGIDFIGGMDMNLA
jgi:predicted nucleic acid-binding protein